MSEGREPEPFRKLRPPRKSRTHKNEEMTPHPSSLKTEFRVLAVDECSGKGPIGVVYRGGLYLDGVLLFDQTAKSASQMGKTIRESKYFPELKILMFHYRSDTMDLESVEKETRLPLLTVFTEEPRNKKSFESFRSYRGRIWVRTSINTATVQRILDLTCTAGRLPEPVRVAHLLGRSTDFRPSTR